MIRKWLPWFIVTAFILIFIAISQQVNRLSVVLTPTPNPEVSLTTSTPTVSSLIPTISASPTPTQSQIIINSPTTNQLVKSPLTVTGQAKGSWFFEAVAPIRLLDSNGKILATSQIRAQGDWMTNDFVPFTGQLNFTNPPTPTGLLILEKDNPSGLPQNAQSTTIPVRFY